MAAEGIREREKNEKCLGLGVRILRDDIWWAGEIEVLCGPLTGQS
jgi:hypothetical protein